MIYNVLHVKRARANLYPRLRMARGRVMSAKTCLVARGDKAAYFISSSTSVQRRTEILTGGFLAENRGQRSRLIVAEEKIQRDVDFVIL